MVDVRQCPGVDWPRCVELANHKEALALELLQMFINSLPAELTQLRASFATNNIPELKKQAHKLDGGLCYCAIPQLHQDIIALERACVQQDNDAIIHNASRVEKQFKEMIDFAKAN